MSAYDKRRMRSAARLGSLIAIAFAIGACSSVSSAIDSVMPSSKPASADAVATADAPAGTTATPGAVDALEFACPEVTVRSGAGTLLVGSNKSNGEVGAMDLRYQGSLVRFARDCTPKAGTMTVKLGIEGRVVTGPAGEAGPLEVPLRIAVVQEGPEPKVVLSKLVRIPVAVSAETGGTAFTHIDPDIAFPIPRPASLLSSYVIYVGFDSAAAAPKPAAKPRPKKKT